MDGSKLRDEEAPPAYESSPAMTAPPPPNYSDGQHDSAPPPSYDSIFGKVKSAKQESSGTLDFFKKLFVIIIGTVGFTICLGIVLALPISMIVIGAIYKNDCTIERYIPIYLIVAGAFGIVKNLSSLAQRFKNRGEDDADERNTKTNPFDMLINCFLLAWFIAGNVWIYSVHNEVDPNPLSPNYCHTTLYQFAFWVTTATYIIMGTTCCCVCFCGILAAATS